MPARIRGRVLAAVAVTMLVAAGGADGRQWWIHSLPEMSGSDGRYEGARRDGQPHGQGVMVSPEAGWRYEGGWRGGRQHGHGVMVWPEGIRYEGGWRDGQPHGHGVYTVYMNGWHDDDVGFRYEGGFYYGLMHGQGVVTGPLLGRIEGEFYYGRQHGQGVYTLPGGTRYEGGWLYGMWHGHGFMTWSDKDSYLAGQWRWGEFYEGRGVRNYLDIDRYEEEGVFTDGDRYVGEWRDYKYHGQGVYTTPDGGRYEGDWRWGQWHGQGVYTSPDGTRYEGEFSAGRRHGYGVRTSPGGEREAGMFYKDRFIGRCSQDELRQGSSLPGASPSAPGDVAGREVVKQPGR